MRYTLTFVMGSHYTLINCKDNEIAAVILEYFKKGYILKTIKEVAKHV